MPDETETQSVENLESQAVAQATESETVYENRHDSVEEHRKRNDAEYNWAEARRKMQELERQIKERDDVLARFQQHMAPKQEVDELDSLADDDIVTKAQARKMAEKMARQEAEKLFRERDASTVGERVKIKFPDYDDVVTEENVQLLKKQKPELALSLAHNPDPYAQAIAVYDSLKMIGVNGQKVPPVEKEKALKNAQKPLSVNAITQNSAIGNVHLFENGLTPQLKEQLWKEMKECHKHY
jgi:hypothetical protein